MNPQRRAGLRRHGKQLARFGAVGIACAITDFGLFALLIALGAAPVPANIVSFLAANVEGYFLNGRVTFRREGGERLSLKGYAKYFAAYAASLVLSTAIVALFAGKIGPLYAKAIATALAAVWNYLFSALIVFKPAQGREDT